MRVEQQSQNIIDVVKQSIGPEEKSGAVLSQYTTGAAGAAVEKSSVSDNAKSVNLKDATYAKPAAEDKQTVAEEIEASATLDVEERKNQMAVLSNTTSPEDYAKMQEDGFSLDDTTTNTIVTETDKIKAQLAKAGVDISFFGDDLDYEQMAAITGSEALARQLAQAMKEADLPCTEENVRGVMEALSLAQTLQTPGDGAVKYMLDNGTALIGQAALQDTMKDIIVDAIGALVMSTVGYISLKYKKGWVEKLTIRFHVKKPEKNGKTKKGKDE